jgi:hypothetical protein
MNQTTSRSSSVLIVARRKSSIRFQCCQAGPHASAEAAAVVERPLQSICQEPKKTASQPNQSRCSGRTKNNGTRACLSCRQMGECGQQLPLRPRTVRRLKPSPLGAPPDPLRTHTASPDGNAFFETSFQGRAGGLGGPRQDAVVWCASTPGIAYAA